MTVFLFPFLRKDQCMGKLSQELNTLIFQPCKIRQSSCFSNVYDFLSGDIIINSNTFRAVINFLQFSIKNKEGKKHARQRCEGQVTRSAFKDPVSRLVQLFQDSWVLVLEGLKPLTQGRL